MIHEMKKYKYKKLLNSKFRFEIYDFSLHNTKDWTSLVCFSLDGTAKYKTFIKAQPIKT